MFRFIVSSVVERVVFALPLYLSARRLGLSRWRALRIAVAPLKK
jgi:hypothetical protein